MRFTSTSRLALWASLLSGGWSSVVPEPQPNGDAIELNNNAAVHTEEQTSHSIRIPCPAGTCQEDDEELELHLEAGQPIHNGICDDLQLTVNGRPLTYFKTFLDGSNSIEGHVSVPVSSVNTQTEHAVNLRIDSLCSPLQSPATVDSHSSESVSNVFDVARVAIESVDGNTVSSQVIVNVGVLGENHQVITSLTSLSDDHTDDPSISEDSSRAQTHDHEDKPSAPPSIEDEVERLNNLRGELKDLKQLVRQQAKYVHALKTDIPDGHPRHRPDWPKCDQTDYKCRLRVWILKSKHCIKSCVGHTIHRVFRIEKPTPPNIDAFVHQYHAGQMKTFTSDKRPTPAQETSNCQYTRIPSSNSDTDSLIDLDDVDIRHKAFVVALFSVASVFCLGVFTCCLRRRCCSPRARADRAARREERRTRREYQTLARRKAFKDWMWRCVPGGRRFVSPGTHDYEEKRSLILQQENILEDAMQAEIRSLQLAHGITPDDAASTSNSISAAEQGRSSHGLTRTRTNSNGTRSLPAYRSRASSGRPPSYSEIERESLSATSMTTLIDGFAIYTPSGSVVAGTPAAASASDITPDSSVADLSPRHSSETLRTERSL